MGSHPVNLFVRFILELMALAAMGLWAWKQSDSWMRFVLVLGVPIIAAAIWGTFAVPDDPSRSGAAPIIVSGIVRLAIEFAFFGFAVWIFWNLGYLRLSWILGTVIALHYMISYDRIMWLLRR